jgi:malate dehydrogenase
MVRAAMGGDTFRWPAGTYVNNKQFGHIMMAMETKITKDGISYKVPTGTPAEIEELTHSYEHLCAMRDEVIAMGVMPEIDKWNTINPNL